MNLKCSTWELVAKALERIIEYSKPPFNLSIKPTRPYYSFESTDGSEVSIYDYMSSFSKCMGCSDECYILTFIYIDRVIQSNTDFILTKRNIRKLVLTGTVLAIKYFDDLYSYNQLYALFGGVTVEELNKLESKMMDLLQFDLYVDESVYSAYVQELSFYYDKIVLTESQSMNTMTTLNEINPS